MTEIEKRCFKSVGKLPEGWLYCRNDALFQERTEFCDESEPISSLLSVSEYYGIARRQDKVDDEIISRAETLDGYRRCYSGDLVMNYMLAWKGAQAISLLDGVVSPSYAVYQPTDKIVPMFAHYLYRTDLFCGLFEANSTGIIKSRLRLYPKTFMKLHSILPPLSEQDAIVSFLNSKCAAINEAISRHATIIKKLKEYRKTVITKSVTGGLRTNVKMKDINLLWVTTIPEDWMVYKISHILDRNHPYPLGDGDHGSIKADDYANDGIPFIRVQNLGYAEALNLSNVIYITEVQNQTIKNSTLKPDDILFAKTGATIGKTAIMPYDIPIANTTSHVGKITVDVTRFFPKYIFYALSSDVGYHQLWDIAGKKATRPEVGLEEVKSLRLIIPNSLEEQKYIAAYLDNQCSKVDEAVSRQKAAIEKLEEYKKSIIYNAVTGKIDCRNYNEEASYESC